MTRIDEFYSLLLTITSQNCVPFPVSQANVKLIFRGGFTTRNLGLVRNLSTEAAVEIRTLLDLVGNVRKRVE